MRDASLLGPWVRRFLMEHLTGERNLARNTQRSYRDALRLLLPSVARRARKPIDRLAVTDVSAERVRQFLNDVEEKRGCGIATRNQRLAAIHDLASVLIRGKGSKPRRCPLWAQTVRELTVLVRERDPNEHVFLNRYRQPITRFGIHTLVERSAARAATKVESLAAKRVSPHTI